MEIKIWNNKGDVLDMILSDDDTEEMHNKLTYAILDTLSCGKESGMKTRVEELVGIRDNLEIYAALEERENRRGGTHIDRDIYGMFGDLSAVQARFMARGITFALSALNDEEDK